MSVILVPGATGGVGKRVVHRLLQQNYQVRALVRDLSRAKAMLGDEVQYVEGDLILPETLQGIMEDVSAIVCCTGTKVQPIEGDTPTREKYYQGIKFYMPEVVDVPELVEYEGIKNLVQVAIESHRFGQAGQSTPEFIMIGSAGVTRPGRPGLNLEEEPPAVRMNEQLGGILTWKLRGEEVVRQSGLIYTIIRPCALTEKPGDKNLAVDQGDTLKGEVSREAIADFCLHLLKSPLGNHKTFEVREEPDVGENDWDALLNSLTPDSQEESATD